MKRIVKRNNENANLKTLNHLITIDYVLALKSDNFAASKKTNSIVFVLVLNRKIITVKKKIKNFMLLYFNSRGHCIFRLPVSP